MPDCVVYFSSLTQLVFLYLAFRFDELLILLLPVVVSSLQAFQGGSIVKE